jgi:hypothetical protein
MGKEKHLFSDKHSQIADWKNSERTGARRPQQESCATKKPLVRAEAASAIYVREKQLGCAWMEEKRERQAGKP